MAKYVVSDLKTKPTVRVYRGRPLGLVATIMGASPGTLKNVAAVAAEMGARPDSKFHTHETVQVNGEGGSNGS